MTHNLSLDAAQKLLNNSDARDRSTIEYKSKWPSDDDHERITKAANSGAPHVVLSDGLYQLTPCKHQVSGLDRHNRCVYVKPATGMLPCGHFTY